MPSPKGTGKSTQRNVHSIWFLGSRGAAVAGLFHEFCGPALFETTQAGQPDPDIPLPIARIARKFRLRGLVELQDHPRIEPSPEMRHSKENRE